MSTYSFRDHSVKRDRINILRHHDEISSEEGGGARAKNMEYKGPPMTPIFLMTSFNRGAWGGPLGKQRACILFVIILWKDTDNYSIGCLKSTGINMTSSMLRGGGKKHEI